MAEKETGTTTVATMLQFDDYVEACNESVHLLKSRMAYKGVEMSDLEAWQYLCWCHDGAANVIVEMAGKPGLEIVTYARSMVSQAASASFIQKRTGVLSGPVGPRYSDPLEFERARRRPGDDTKPTPDPTYKGYL